MHTLFRSLLLSPAWRGNKLLNSNFRACLQRCEHSKAQTDSVKATENKNVLQWEISAAVCLTRLPIVTSQLTQLEEHYLDLLEKQEYERSVLSDWEVEKTRQYEIIKAIESGEKSADDMDFKITHQDREDEFEKKLKTFTPSERKTEHDNDMTSVNRRIEDPLTYVVSKKFGNDVIWMLPTVPIQDGENLRECAERALATHCQDKFHGKILSNAPSGYYKFKFPKEVRMKNSDDCLGAKVFIFPALLMQGKPPENAWAREEGGEKEDNILSYAWATQDELAKYLKPKYFEALKKILP